MSYLPNVTNYYGIFSNIYDIINFLFTIGYFRYVIIYTEYVFISCRDPYMEKKIMILKICREVEEKIENLTKIFRH